MVGGFVGSALERSQKKKSIKIVLSREYLCLDGEKEENFVGNIRDGLEGKKEDGGCCESFGEHLDR